MLILSHLRNAAIGVISPAVGSVILAFGVALSVGYLVHPFEEFGWLFRVSVLPSTVVILIVGALEYRAQYSARRVHLFSLIAAFVTVTMAGSIGAIAVGAIRFGIEGVNVVGYLKWSSVYGIALLPISLPISLVAIRKVNRDTS